MTTPPNCFRRTSRSQKAARQRESPFPVLCLSCASPFAALPSILPFPAHRPELGLPGMWRLNWGRPTYVSSVHLGFCMIQSRTGCAAGVNLRLYLNPIVFSAVAILCAILAASAIRAQEIVLNVTYICNGERIYVYGCDIRDKSDSAWCSVGHPEKPRNGMDSYTNTTRGELKKLLPTCQQPNAQQLAKRKQFDQQLQAQRDADEKKAYDQMHAPDTATMPGQRQMTPEQRKINRCVTSGRLPATCTGNALMRGFDELTGHVMSAVAPDLAPGPEITGAFEGAGKWRIDFGDRGAAMKCSVLGASSYTYTVQTRETTAP